MKKDLIDMKITLSNNDLLTQQSVETTKKLSETMEVMKTTMVEVAQSVKDSNRINGEMTKTIEELSKKISSVESSTKQSINCFSEKLDKIDNKGKLDIVEWLKSKWFEVVTAIGVLIYAISQYVK